MPSSQNMEVTYQRASTNMLPRDYVTTTIAAVAVVTAAAVVAVAATVAVCLCQNLLSNGNHPGPGAHWTCFTSSTISRNNEGSTTIIRIYSLSAYTRKSFCEGKFSF